MICWEEAPATRHVQWVCTRLHWRAEYLNGNAWLASRFTYEEEATPEDFFVPLVWSLVVSDSLIPWQHSAITLFSSQGVSRSSSDADERIEDGVLQVSRDAKSSEQARSAPQLTNGLDVV